MVCHHREEVVPGVDGLQAAPLPPPVVRRDSVLSASLDVQRNQVHAEPGPGFCKQKENVLKEIPTNYLRGTLEQMVGHLLGHRVVKGLGNLTTDGGSIFEMLDNDSCVATWLMRPST